MTATQLAAQKCVPCLGQTPLLSSSRARELLKLIPMWALAPDEKRLTRTWRVLDFATGLDFFQRIADVAEAEDHHPDLHLTGYRNVAVEIWTHAAGGLTENDFILAAKIDTIGEPALK